MDGSKEIDAVSRAMTHIFSGVRKISNLSECQLMSFPDAVYHLMRNTVLISCDLSSNVFRKIPPQLPMKFFNISELNLSNNRLSTLPEELKDLKELLRLDLSHNDFMILPKVAFKIPHLVFLSLKQNFIVGTYFEAPFLINELQKCYDLDLENCLRCRHFQSPNCPFSKRTEHGRQPFDENILHPTPIHPFRQTSGTCNGTQT
ncbi:UNVERIFIED_CONTAM: Leucine-rich repeat-containing protein 20 [Trichonephila clavipes]